MKRAIIIVLDSVGIGEMPDAGEFGDAGANTLGHVAGSIDDFSLPNMEKMGLGNIAPLRGVPPSPAPSGAYGKLGEQSRGKDTTVGHWEIAGLVSTVPFPVYPEGFPPDLVAAFEKKIGRKTLGNYPASGTEIIKDLGEEHMKTGFPIIYTSADSVFQVAAHEEVIPLPELYRICRQARELLHGKHGVARVIARPFTGSPGNFERTAHRHDFSFLPPADTILDVLTRHGLKTYGVGKINDIFAGKGVSETIGIENNRDGVDKTLKAMEKDGFSLIFTNLVDFDMLYGHRRNVVAYGKALEDFDARVPEILRAMRPEDMLFFTADHGCDPTFTAHTDHTREYIPLLVNGSMVKPGVDLGTRDSFADIAQTIAGYLGMPELKYGKSFLGEITK
ncbi:MAG: phosphopentomutase [Candidatus Euphemobacter frigidus]|nr:phosphopentomutase [Candidatus Euphemobacter frigidus]MDP8275704.1 phosphopentomutase [Candidatus Euphemobacter frigidus]